MATPDIWQKRIEPLLARVDNNRRRDFQSAFLGLPEASFVTNTGKTEKALAQLSLIQHYINVPLLLNDEAFLYDNPHQEEITSPEASEVAEWKARQVLLYPRFIQGEAKPEVIAAGADINAFRRVGNEMIHEHKLARIKPDLLRVKRDLIRQTLIDGYSNPPTQKVENRWDLGTHFINGRSHQFGDQIEVISKPVDRELMVQALDEAEESGLYLSSNLHFAAFETLRLNDKIQSVAFLPQELKEEGITFEDIRQSPTPDLLERAQQSIITNVPVRHQH